MAEPAKDTTTTADAGEDTMHGKYLVFTLDAQEFAIPIECVGDIINIQPYTRMPNCPDYVRGITNLRGKVIPLIDVRMRFGKPTQEYNDRTCIVVVQHESSVGLVIDSVKEVITLQDEDIAPPPGFNSSPESRFVSGIGRSDTGVKLILDYHTLLGEDTTHLMPEQEDAE